MNKIITREQSDCAKSRYIGENIRLILEIIEHKETYNLYGLLFFSELLKAFYRNHNCIPQSLQNFDFGESLMS